MQLLQPEDARSEYEALWLTLIAEKLDEGWRVAYSDGCGRDNHNSFACHRENRRGGDTNTTGGYLGPISTVADSERRGILEALQTDEDMLLVLTDRMAAKATTMNLSRGAAPRSQIEVQIKAALRRRQALGLDTGISWVRAHIGIKGNELADQHATFQSYRGQIANVTRTGTEGGIRWIAKEARASERKVASFGLGNRVNWGRRALATYTWFREGKGPQRQWLYKIGKVEDPSSDCGAEVLAGLGNVATQEGLRAYGKDIRKGYRQQAGYGKGRRPLWGRKALSAYTWMRCNKGPHREWLHQLRKVASPLCDCGEVQSRDHITFQCPLHRTARRALLGDPSSWGELDAPRYEEDDEDQEHDLVEEFFGYIFAHFV